MLSAAGQNRSPATREMRQAENYWLTYVEPAYRLPSLFLQPNFSL